MDKIVVQYDIDGGYECGSYLCVECLEYESIEAFYVHFEEKLIAYENALKLNAEMYEKWQPTFNRLALELGRVRQQTPSAKRQKHLEELEAEFRENEKLRPRHPIDGHQFTLGGVEFEAEHFVRQRRGEFVNQEGYEREMPIVMKLDEWFQAKRDGKL